MKKEMEIQLAQIKIVNSLSELDTKQQTKGRQPIGSAFSSLNTYLVLQIQVDTLLSSNGSGHYAANTEQQCNSFPIIHYLDLLTVS